jgi:hypothetical protein
LEGWESFSVEIFLNYHPDIFKRIPYRFGKHVLPPIYFQSKAKLHLGIDQYPYEQKCAKCDITNNLISEEKPILEG